MTLPLVVTALVVHPEGLILSVSRKQNLDDLGLPGGKVDPGETLEQACIREVREETGLSVVSLRPVFSFPCGKEPRVHACTTFLVKVEGRIHTTEAGRVVWVHPRRLVQDDHGVMNSFGEYNHKLLGTFRLNRLQRDWMSDIKLTEAQVIRG